MQSVDLFTQMLESMGRIAILTFSITVNYGDLLLTMYIPEDECLPGSIESETRIIREFGFYTYVNRKAAIIKPGLYYFMLKILYTN